MIEIYGVLVTSQNAFRAGFTHPFPVEAKLNELYSAMLHAAPCRMYRGVETNQVYILILYPILEGNSCGRSPPRLDRNQYKARGVVALQLETVSRHQNELWIVAQYLILQHLNHDYFALGAIGLGAMKPYQLRVPIMAKASPR
ncbi:hypothetical protein J6590_094117 [Homalodisca vitripennis]|nr:hypothetical protein J6590_094117 [Homalodisca vitripennis]